MRAILQRVSWANVKVAEEMISEISRGYLILLGVEKGDTEQNAELLARKTLNLRVFEDTNEKMNLSLLDVDGEVLVISNFTLYADCKKGRRPSFINAQSPEIAKDLYDKYCDLLESGGAKSVKKGIFGADMQVGILNDGPVTIILDTKELV